MAGCDVHLIRILLVFLALSCLASDWRQICILDEHVYTLREHDIAFFQPPNLNTEITIQSDSCQFFKKLKFHTPKKLGNNTHLQDSRGWQWYEISFFIDDPVFYVIVEAQNTLNASLTWDPPPGCNITQGVQFSFDDFTVLGIDCPQQISDLEDSSIYAFKNTYQDETYYKSSYSGSHIIFIPVGAILVCLSVCCRCCFRHRRTLRPVRTIAVVRSVAATPVIVTTQRDVDHPPSYNDIQNDCEQPPPYSEIEKECSPPPTQLASAETSTISTTATVAHTSDVTENPRLTSASRIFRMLPSRPKAQFSFKPLNEEN
ncbi:hypothetical protein OTU49_001661 [Cherax quadricarinatus]|uniref:Uncharacterized protein n=1 Tax=Cherax quadricarinatus TaxID=27406 RepID=A0AAW0XXR2_CHEQU|nr:uncharacterized protein LOC128691139 [Cherax quadricarinatus]